MAELVRHDEKDVGPTVDTGCAVGSCPRGDYGVVHILLLNP